MSYRTDAEKIARSFLQKADAYEHKELMVLVNRWKGISENLNTLIQQIAEKEFPSKDQLFKSDLYKQFMKEAEAEISRYNSFAEGTVKNGQSVFARIGLESSQKEIALLNVRFNKINFKAVENMIGLTSEGSSLSKLFEKSFPEVYQRLNQQLVNSISLGFGPRKTATLLTKISDMPLYRSLRIARTEQLSVMRQTSLEQMKASGVVNGWIRIEQDDACDDCQELNGKHFDLDEDFETHPNCRGTNIPDI
jgi:SPP1 gp7 family putative phage head morphogenesis protein